MNNLKRTPALSQNERNHRWWFKQKEKGWVFVHLFMPLIVRTQLLELKKQLMAEYRKQGGK
jgi:hypothetical protein